MTKNKLYRRIVSLADFIQELGKYDYYNKASNFAIQDYDKFVQYFKGSIDKLDVFHYDKLYRLINSHIIPNIRYIQRTETKNIPWSLISNLDEILKNELGNDCWLLFRPQWHFNYSVITEDLVTYLKDILYIFFPDDNGINKIFSNEKIHIFSFPFLEKTNVLLNSIIGHEIGHFYHRKWEQSDDYTKIKENHNKILKKHYDNLLPEDLIKPYENTEEGMNIINGMYREIISDIYGYFLFGPSVIFALLELSEFEVKQIMPSKENRYYPSNKYRIKILVDNLLRNDKGVNSLLAEDNDCSKYFYKYISDINEYLGKKDEINLFSLEKKKEIELFEASLPGIIQKIKDSIKHDYLKYENTHKLFENLKENLPINELNYVPIDIMQIIFTGWIYYKKINEDYSGDEYVLNCQILMRILLKSLHSSFINKKYIEKG